MAWDLTRTGMVDIRLFYTNGAVKGEINEDWTNPANDITPQSWTQCRWDPQDESIPKFYRFSAVVRDDDDQPTQICYTTESLKYAQSGYLVSIVCVQWSDLMICKTRNLSISQQGMKNIYGNFGLFFETALVAFLLYVPFCNRVLFTRAIPVPQFALPSFSFFALIIMYDEMRKLMVREGMRRNEQTGAVKLTGWFAQNTYY